MKLIVRLGNKIMGLFSKPQDKDDKMRAIKCTSCGASLVGHVGSVIICEYCDTSMNV